MSARVADFPVGCGLDWGGSGPSSKPGCVELGLALPDSRVHIFDELKMIRLSIKEASEAIRDKCLGVWRLPSMPSIFCDPALKAKTGQIGEDYLQTFARYKVTLIPVSNNRNMGWQRTHEALRANTSGVPWLTVHPRCKYLIRTFPLMVQSANDPEDLDSATDDHAVDALRYLLMGGLRAGTVAMLRKETPYLSLDWYKQQVARMLEHEGVLA